MKKKILIINSTLDLYGANRILSLVIGFLQKHYSVFLLIPAREGLLIDYLKKHNLKFELIVNENMPIIQRKMFSVSGVFLAFKQMLDFYFYLKKESKKHDFQFVYVNTLSNVLSIPLLYLLKLKIITHVHEIIESPIFIARIINNICLNYSSIVIAVSYAVKRNLEGGRKLTKRKIHVIHNGIKDLFDLNHLPPHQNKVNITLIARIKPEKGIWYFLDALKQMKNKEIVSVKIIGGPPPFGEKLVDKLKKDIQDFQMDIQIIEFLENVQFYLNETDILVVPSLMKDPFPTTVLEGMSCEKAVIATNTGGAQEAIENGVSGIIINPYDSTNFANYLDYLVENKEVRKSYGQKARERFLKEFTLSAFEKRLNNLFIQDRPW